MGGIRACNAPWFSPKYLNLPETAPLASLSPRPGGVYKVVENRLNASPTFNFPLTPLLDDLSEPNVMAYFIHEFLTTAVEAAELQAELQGPVIALFLCSFGLLGYCLWALGLEPRKGRGRHKGF